MYLLHRVKGGFTLIELLIVVAIIAILAAIAVPNFLEAQVRSKVSRAKADLRSLATGLEAYAVDNNHYPPPIDFGIPLIWGDVTSPPYNAKISNYITTPVAYLSSLPLDVFATNRPLPSPPPGNVNMFKRFFYIDTEYLSANPSFAPGNNNPITVAGMQAGIWAMFSIGPDLQEYNGHPGGPGSDEFYFRDYDPTNGSVSFGNIFRTHKSGDVIGYHPVFWMNP